MACKELSGPILRESDQEIRDSDWFKQSRNEEEVDMEGNVRKR